MYAQYFNLTEFPFAMSPVPRYLYLSEVHREALEHLVSAISSDESITLLTGESGTGKTILGYWLHQHNQDTVDFAFIPNPQITAYDLLESICGELELYPARGRGSIRAFIEQIHLHLLDAHKVGRKTVILIDEAQNLDANVLKQLHLLTTLETGTRKSLRVILTGKPELLGFLGQPYLKEVNQSITSRYQLSPLRPAEVGKYIDHRLSVAGNGKDALFSAQAIKHVAKLTQGLPRSINLLCDRALLAAFAVNAEHVDISIMAQTGKDVLPQTNRVRILHGRKMVIGGTALFSLLIFTFFQFFTSNGELALPEPSPAEIAAEVSGEKSVNDMRETASNRQSAMISKEVEKSDTIALNTLVEKTCSDSADDTSAQDIVFLSTTESVYEGTAEANRADPFMPPKVQSNTIRISAPLLVLEDAGPVPQETVEKLLAR